MIDFVQLGPSDYDRAKRVLNAAKHPGFVGRELFFRCATEGGAWVAVVDEQDCGVALIAKHRLQALSVAVSAQGRGVGKALMARLKPRWVNAIGEKVGFFESLGYKQVGAPKVGQNGKHTTHLLELGETVKGEVPGSVEIAPAKSKGKRTPGEKRKIILRIAEVMAIGHWSRGYALDLADELECTPQYVDQLASAASSVLDLTVNDRQKLNDLCKVKLLKIADEDDRDRVNAITTLLRANGGLLDKVEVSPPPAPEALWSSVDEWLANPTPELVERLERHGWRRTVVETEGETV